jgi:hypothetical protein
MNILHSPTLPSLSVFNKLILDSLGLWGGDIVDVKFDVAATEEQRKKVLNKAFEEHRNSDGTFGPTSSVLKTMEDNAPQGDVLQRKARTIRDIVQHFSKEDFRNSHELDELDPYIEGVIKEKFIAPQLRDFIIKTRSLLIEHYKEFVREFSPKEHNTLDSYQFFLTNIATSVICKSLLSTLFNSHSSAALKAEAISFDSKEDGELWPLKAYFEGLLKKSKLSAYKLHQFHEIKLNNQGKKTVDIWSMLSPSTLTNTKSKQAVERFNRKNKMSWDIVWKQISPLVSPLSTEENIVMLNSFSAYWIHNIAISLESSLQDKALFECALSDIYKSIEYSKEKSLVDSKNICLQPLTDLYDEAESAEYEDRSLPVITPYLKEEIEKYRAWLANSSFFERNLLPNEFITFWNLDSEEDFNLKRQQALIAEIYSTSNLDWIKHWCDARRFILKGYMDKALQSYKSAFASAKYRSGRYFLYLYFDICAFCKIRYQYFSARKEVDIFDRFYEVLGDGASKYAGLLGFTPKSKRNPKTLLPDSDLKLKNGIIVHMIDMTVNKIQKIQSNTGEIYEK